MRIANLKDMAKGWFVGNFSPTVYSTENAEVAVKTYKAGDKEQAHYHKIATEITVVQSGEVIMFGKKVESRRHYCSRTYGRNGV